MMLRLTDMIHLLSEGGGMGQKTLCKSQCNIKRRQTILMMSKVT